MADYHEPDTRFICDAMLGGLAHWLRAAGYDALYKYGIEDDRLLARAAQEDRIVLSSDGPLFQRNVIKNGDVNALYIPQQLSKFAQLEYVIKKLDLPRREPRCMSCGGLPVEVHKHEVMSEIPPLAYKNCDRFWRCRRCGKLLWRGTHWDRIAPRLDEIASQD